MRTGSASDQGSRVCGECRRKVDRPGPRPGAAQVTSCKVCEGAQIFARQLWLCNAASICAPLTDLLRKQAKFSWGPAQDAALEALKREVESAAVLGN